CRRESSNSATSFHQGDRRCMDTHRLHRQAAAVAQPRARSSPRLVRDELLPSAACSASISPLTANTTVSGAAERWIRWVNRLLLHSTKRTMCPPILNGWFY